MVIGFITGLLSDPDVATSIPYLAYQQCAGRQRQHARVCRQLKMYFNTLARPVMGWPAAVPGRASLLISTAFDFDPLGFPSGVGYESIHSMFGSG